MIDIDRTVATIAAEIEAHGDVATRAGQRGGLRALAAQVGALPALIERQVREQVAREIHAFASDPQFRLSGHSGISVRAVRGIAASIARGES